MGKADNGGRSFVVALRVEPSDIAAMRHGAQLERPV